MIVAHNQGGLGNRIKCIVSCLRYGDQNQIPCRIHWPIVKDYETNHHLLNCPFSELFQNPLEIDKIDEEMETYESHCLKIFDSDNLPDNFDTYEPNYAKHQGNDIRGRNIDFNYQKIPEKVRYQYVKYFSQLELRPQLSKKVNEFSKKFSSHTISVHIRSWAGQNEEGRNYILFQKGIEKFESEMLKYKNHNFFLSSDSEKVLEYFQKKSILQKRIICYPRNTSLKNSRGSIEGVQEDLIELYLLSKNSKIIGSHNSTFTEVAWWLGNCPDITIIPDRVWNANLSKVKVGIAISTYTEEKTDPKRYEIIDKSLMSLQESLSLSKIKHAVMIVVDGPIPDIHNKILEKYNFPIYRRKENGGVAKTKNTSIRLLLEKKIQIGYLADDDILYKKNFLEEYTNTILNTNIHHMSYCQMDPIVHPPDTWKKMGYYPVSHRRNIIMKHGGKGVGCWMSFTPQLIKNIGYFKVMKGKYGYEHINFTYRCLYHHQIPCISDILNPHHFLKHIGFEPVTLNQYHKNHSISEEYRKRENEKNKREWNRDFHKYVELVE